MEKSIGQEIFGAGWRTGSIVDPASNEKLHALLISRGDVRLAEALSSGGRAIVISQWCDLVHEKLSVEPDVEFAVAKDATNPDPNIALYKSYRQLQLVEETGSLVAFSANDRFFAPREILLGMAASNTLSFQNSRNLTQWLGARYRRLPLPNELVKRIPWRVDPLKSALTKLNPELYEIRASINPPDVELTSDQNYLIVLYFITKRPQLSPSGAAAYDKLKTALGKLSGINAQVKITPGDTFTYNQMLQTERLDLEAFTYGQLDGAVRGLQPAE